jgi:hypothetical protein
MDPNDQIVDFILRKIRTEVREFVELEPKFKCPIEYEKKVLEISMRFCKINDVESQKHTMVMIIL